MKLTRTERWLLSNQYRILEALYPDEASYFADNREILESGYEYHYGDACRDIDAEPMSEDRCREVLDILNMFRMIRYSLDEIENKSGVNERAAEFRGFDGNNEYREMAYATWYCSHDGGRFDELNVKNLNSHTPMLDRYRRMMAAWKPLDEIQHLAGEPRRLTKEEIIQITEAQ